MNALSLPPPPRVERDERLDRPADWPAEQLEEALGQVRAVNRWLGGTAVAVDFLRSQPELAPGSSATLLDVATGSADIPAAMLCWAGGRGIELDVTATDVSPEVLEAARGNVGAGARVRFEPANALALPYRDASFDYVTCNMALHHFTPDAAVLVLREMQRVARRAMLLNDLVRSRPAYWGARAIFMLTDNPLTSHDGPLSVLRSYTVAELRSLAEAAGLRSFSVRWRPIFRLALIATGSG